MPATDAELRTGRWWHAVAVFVAAVTLFLLLPQRGLHGVDGNQFVVWIEEGNTQGYARHAAYLHLCGQIYRVLEPFGAGGSLALRVASALGTAIGLVLLLFAFGRLMPRPGGSAAGSVLAPTIAVLLTPAWFYFATTAEIPGVFAAGVGLAWFALARWLDRPTIAASIGFGCAGALAGSLHALGHLTTPALLVVALLLRRLPTQGRIAQFATILAAHMVTAVMLALLLTRGAAGQASDAASMLADYWRTFAPLTAPAVLWREWIVPYLPWSIGALAALCSRRARPFALASLALLLLHLPVSVIFLGHHEIREFGAYFLAVTPIAVLATAHFVTARGFGLAIAAGAAVTVLTIGPGWRHPVPPDFGSGVEQLDREHKIALVVASKAELAGARTATKGLMAMELGSVIGAYVQFPPPAPPFAQWFDGWHDNLAGLGMTTVLSDAARRFLDSTGDPQLRPFWREHVPARYELREVERAGFRGVMLRRR